MAFSSYGSQQPTTFNRGAPPEDDPNAPPKPPSDQQHAPPQGPSSTGGPSHMQQPQTFAQMQQNGQARPAPPMPQAPQQAPQQQAQAPAAPVPTALQQDTRAAVTNQLANPSGYGSEAVQNSYNDLSKNIDDQYTQAARASDEQLAKRGLFDSTKAVGALSDLNIAKRSAKTDLASQLLDKQAQSASTDRANAIAQALGYDNQQSTNSLAQQGLNLQSRGLDQSYNLGQGNLGVSQGQLALAQTGQQQQYGLAQQQLGQQANQFGQTFGLQQQAQNQNYGLAQQQQALQSALGYGGMDLQKQQLAQSGNQFNQSLAQSGNQFNQQQALGYAQLNSQAQLGNRGIDASTQNANTAAQMQAAALQAALGYAPKNTTPGVTGATIPAWAGQQLANGTANQTPPKQMPAPTGGATYTPANVSGNMAFDPNGVYAQDYNQTDPRYAQRGY